MLSSQLVNLEESWSLKISFNKNVMSKIMPRTYSELDLFIFLF